MPVTGNLEGVPAHVIQRLDKLFSFSLDRDCIIDESLAMELAVVTFLTNKESRDRKI